MTINEIEEISKLIPKFVQMVENDLEEDEHEIEGKPLTYEEFEKIQKLAIKLNNCINFVDGSIFE
jgi:hypothetical protein